MDYAALNTTLRQYFEQFNLNQTRGGGSLTIFHQGKIVTQLAHGEANIQADGSIIPWTADTLALNFSTGKGVLVTLIHVLVSQGLLDYDLPIAHYWPAFAHNHKQSITLRQVLTHEARLFDITSVTERASDMLDWESMVQKVAAMPLSEIANPSLNAQTINLQIVDDNDEATCYSAYSALVSGWILGGLIEMVIGMSLQQALDHYLLTPLDLVGQVYIGVPDEKLLEVAKPFKEKQHHTKPVLVEDRQSTLQFYQSLPFYSVWQTLANTDLSKPLTTQAINGLYFDPTQIDMQDYKSSLVPAGSRNFDYYHPTSLQAKMPAVNGVASSHALATIYAMLANHGNWNHTSVISPRIFEQLATIHNNTFDKVMPAKMQWRLGYHRVFSVMLPSETAFGHIGYNGSMAWCDPVYQLSVAFVHNYDVTMLNDIRQFILNETILDFFSSPDTV